MSNRTSLLFVVSLLSSALLGVGCSSSDSAPASGDSAVDSQSDASGNTCTPAGGTCIALTATSKCPDGSATPSSSAIHCEGAGSMCCVPAATDGGTDASDAASDAKTACESKGGTCIAVTPGSACASGFTPSTDACGGVGASCCIPLDTADAASDTHD